MASDKLRRLIETSSTGVSDGHRRTIEKVDTSPKRTLTRLEREGYNTGRDSFVDNYLGSNESDE